MIDALRKGRPVWIAPSWAIPLPPAQSQSSSTSPLKLLLLTPFLSAVLCMLAAALMLLWQGLVRFGPRRPQSLNTLNSNSSLVSSAASLLERARRTPRMGAQYAQLTRDLATGWARTGQDPDAFVRDMQQRHHTQDDYFALLENARSAQNPSHFVQLMHRLWQWKQEMTRGRQ